MPTEGRDDHRLSHAERLAALIDGKLTADERAEMIRLLAASGTDRELLARVVLYLDPDPGEKHEPVDGGRGPPASG